MLKVNIEGEYWHWHHNVSECYYHIQITIKYRKALLTKGIEKKILSHCKEINRTFAKKIANEKSRFIKREIQNV